MEYATHRRRRPLGHFNSNPDTAPNDAFTPNSANAGVSELLSPVPGQYRFGSADFRNLYNLEDGFDSMPLQIKIGNGAFQDILAAGGSFISGGYNGRNNEGPAWTGLSAGTTASPAYITTSSTCHRRPTGRTCK